jgi:hypothetical protein
MVLNNRRIVGFVTAIVGVLISFGHLVFGIFDRVPEKYHSHQALVAIGFGLTILGLVLLGTEKQR